MNMEDVLMQFYVSEKALFPFLNPLWSMAAEERHSWSGATVSWTQKMCLCGMLVKHNLYGDDGDTSIEILFGQLTTESPSENHGS